MFDRDFPAFRRLFLLQGAAFLLVGILAIALPVVATLATEVLVAWILILAGAAGLLHMIGGGRSVDAWQLGLAYALALALGIVLLTFPLAGVETLTMLLVLFLTLEGVLALLLAARWSRDVGNWIWLVVSGIASLAVALMIVFGWPDTSAWAIGLLLGVNLLSTGFALVMIFVAAPQHG